MITPRQTRLFRAADLRAFQRTIRRLAGHTDVWRARSCAVIVASAAGADQLRRTFENHRLSGTSPADRALGLPQILTRSGWYDAMHSRLPSPPRRLTDLEREVLLNAAARDAATTEEPPFRLRAGLLVEMLALYDDLRRRDSSVDDFERVLVRELQRDADDDRGAARLLKQTRFLAAAFRGYEARRDATGAVDEYALRTMLLEVEPTRPLRQVVVTVGERSVDSAGLWPADLALLTQLPFLEQIDIVATHAAIAAGLLDRLEKFMPGFEEGELPERSRRRDRSFHASCSRRAVGHAAVYREPRSGRRAVVDRSSDEGHGSRRSRSPGGGVQAPPAVCVSRARRLCGCRASRIRPSTRSRWLRSRTRLRSIWFSSS